MPDPIYDICRCGCERRKHRDDAPHAANSSAVAWTRWCDCRTFEKAPPCPDAGIFGRPCTLSEGHGGPHVAISDPERKFIMEVKDEP